MLNLLKRLVGAVTVKEDEHLIHVGGISTKAMIKEFMDVWHTSRLADNMFTHVESSGFSFNKFFAIDFYYALETVVAQPKEKRHYRVLRRVMELLLENTWIGAIKKEHPDILNFSKLSALNVTLKPHQLEFLQQYNEVVPKYNLTGYMLAAAPGTGKTISGLALSLALEAEVVVCIVPKNAVDEVWAQTLETRFKKPQKYWKSTDGNRPQPGCQYYIFHYEQLEQAVAFFRSQRYKRAVVILDESHNFNSTDSLRTGLFVELCRILKALHVLWSSGTPIKAIGNEAIPLLSTIDPYFDEDAKQRFQKIFGKNSVRAIDILRNRMGIVTFKVNKDVIVDTQLTSLQVGVKIPNGEDYTLDKIRQEMADFIVARIKHYRENFDSYLSTYQVCLSIHEGRLRGEAAFEEFRRYKSYVTLLRQGYDPATMKDIVVFCNQYENKEIIPYLDKKHKESFSQARSVVKYYQLKVQGEALGRVLGKKREQCHVDMVRYSGVQEYIDTAVKKTVIFTSFVKVVDEMSQYLDEEGYKPLKVYGETNKDLQPIVRKFESDIDANPLVATYQSLSTAVPLVMASTAIMLNAPFRAHEWEQATSRLNRMGQDSPVTVYNLFLDTGDKPNISTRSKDIMEWSKAQVEAIMGMKMSDAGGIALESESDLHNWIEGHAITSTKSPDWLKW